MWGPVESKVPEGRTVTSDDLLHLLKSGDIQVRPNIERIDGAEIVFEDGSQAQPTSIVFCTGYARNFPFLSVSRSESVAVLPDFSIELYKHVFHPELPGLSFVGMCRVQGSVFPIIELQARWVARVLAGKIPLPLADRMRADIDARRRRHKKLGIAPMRVGFLEYADEIAREIGAQPRLWRHPRRLRSLLTGPADASHFRLDGPARTTPQSDQAAIRE
jgi:hypothetical protein